MGKVLFVLLSLCLNLLGAFGLASTSSAFTLIDFGFVGVGFGMGRLITNSVFVLAGAVFLGVFGEVSAFGVGVVVIVAVPSWGWEGLCPPVFWPLPAFAPFNGGFLGFEVLLCGVR